MRTPRYIPNYTVADYRMWDGAWELIDGVPTAMSPSPVRKHQRVSGAIYNHLFNSVAALSDSCGTCDVVYELDWIMDDTNVLRPDVAVICGENGEFISKAPVLIVEVVSPSTALKDRHVKYQIYEEQGVLYYIIADPATMVYKAYHLQNGIYTDYDQNIFTFHEGCTITMDIQQILAGIG